MPLEHGDWPVEEPAAQQDPAGEVTGSDSLDGPLPVPTPGSPVLEPHRVGPEASNPPQAKEVLPVFDPKVREDFEGLLYLGRLSTTFTRLGHDFEIRTLTTGEILEIGMLAKPYRDSMADVKAYQAAVVAACVTRVDGRPMPTPVTDDVLDTGMSNRFNYVLRSWFPPLLDIVYEQYLLLEDRVGQVLEAMGKASR